jgi:Co/Zn/Cd efflux system component
MALFVVVEAIGGVLTSSLALFALAAQALQGTAQTVMAERLRPRAHSRDRLRDAVSAAFLVSALAAGLAAHLLVAAVERLGSFTHVRSGPATAFAIFALIVHLLVLRRIPRRKPGFESGRSLFAGSVFSVAATTAAALASGLGWMNVWHGADAAAAVIIALMIPCAAWRMVSDAIMHLVPVSARVTTDGSRPAEAVAEEVRTVLIEQFGIAHAHLQVEQRESGIPLPAFGGRSGVHEA